MIKKVFVIIVTTLFYSFIFLTPLIPTTIFSVSLYQLSNRWLNENYLLENGTKVNGLITGTESVTVKNRHYSSFTYQYSYGQKTYSRLYDIKEGYKSTLQNGVKKGSTLPFYIDPENPNESVPGFIEPHYLNEYWFPLSYHVLAILFGLTFIIFLFKKLKIKETLLTKKPNRDESQKKIESAK